MLREGTYNTSLFARRTSLRAVEDSDSTADADGDDVTASSPPQTPSIARQHSAPSNADGFAAAAGISPSLLERSGDVDGGGDDRDWFARSSSSSSRRLAASFQETTPPPPRQFQYISEIAPRHDRCGLGASVDVQSFDSFFLRFERHRGGRGASLGSHAMMTTTTRPTTKMKAAMTSRCGGGAEEAIWSSQPSDPRLLPAHRGVLAQKEGAVDRYRVHPAAVVRVGSRSIDLPSGRRARQRDRWQRRMRMLFGFAGAAAALPRPKKSRRQVPLPARQRRGDPSWTRCPSTSSLSC